MNRITSKSALLLVGLIILLVLSACNAAGLSGDDEAADQPTETPAAAGSLVIDSPPSGATGSVGEELLVQSTAQDEAGVLRIDLQVDGTVVDSNTAPEEAPQPQFSVLQSWIPDSPGEYTIMTASYRADGSQSATSSITVSVEEAEVSEEESSEPEPCMARADTNLNIRQGGSTAHGIVGSLAMGEEATVTGRDNNTTWYQIDGTGWVYAAYITTSGECGSIPTASFPAASSGGHSDGGDTGGGDTSGDSGSTNPTPTAEATEEMDEEPTEEATEEATEDMTEEPTEEATEDMTEEPTEEATEEGQVAPFDNDALTNPAAELEGKNTPYSDVISAPEGDTEDWVYFESGSGNNQGTATRWFTLECTGDILHSNGQTVIVRAEIWNMDTNQRESGTQFWCGVTDKQIGLDENTTYAIRIYYSGQEQQSYAQYTVTMKRSSF